VVQIILNKKRISIKDIASVAGVSHPTVSRALRGEGRFSEETRSRIIHIAQELGYTPNLVARGLVTQRTRSIGIVVTNIADPFHSQIIRGVEYVIRGADYSLFLGSTTADPEQELQVVRSFVGRNVDGIIVASSQVGDRYTDILDELDLPIVLINSHAEGSNLHSVSHDDYAGASLIVEHLLHQGYRRIAFLGHRQAGRVHGERRRAWQDRLRQYDLEPGVSVDAPEPTIEQGAAGIDTLFSHSEAFWGRPADAIFCYNDLLAIGVIGELRRRGLRVPQNIAVAGFDDLDVAAYIDPPLTTLHQPRYEMGVQASEMLLTLLDQAGQNAGRPQQIRVLGKLVVRGSTHLEWQGQIDD
jgi:LacI family transcriptional regulator, repressor for deo operon, udp, cdd, tsx, nupC, and nupG